MSTKALDIELMGVRHSAHLLPEFEGGSLGISQSHGRIVVEHVAGFVYSRRRPSEVIGWRLACRCDQMKKDRPAVHPWISEQFWVRVDDPNVHDPLEYRVYAPDELTMDIVELQDVHAAAHDDWEQHHIQSWSALSRISTAIRSMKDAQREFEAAIKDAKGTGLIDPVIRASMGLRPHQIRSLGELLGGEADG